MSLPWDKDVVKRLRDSPIKMTLVIFFFLQVLPTESIILTTFFSSHLCLWLAYGLQLHCLIKLAPS